MAWEWIKGRGGYRVLVDGEETILSSDDEIAEYTTDHVISWVDVSDEHARLIAAAPDLLAALVLCFGEPGLCITDGTIANARAAIAKATQP